MKTDKPDMTDKLEKIGRDKPVTEQSLKAAARQGAKTAPKADPDIAARALADAQSQPASRRPAQKLSATPLNASAGDNRHHPKDQILSEFDGPTDT